MDDSVIDAIKRWPNVPAVFGWLSLTARGQWRLHPDGKAVEGGMGESISNPQILGFINRNYDHDELGRWFFQNGPQRVYVRLDAAPWIVFADDSQGELSTHTGLAIQTVTQLELDDSGNLYLSTEHGAGMLIDRDLPRFIQTLNTVDGQALEQWWAQSQDSQTALSASLWRALADGVSVKRIQAQLPSDLQLGFVRNPTAAT